MHFCHPKLQAEHLTRILRAEQHRLETVKLTEIGMSKHTRLTDALRQKKSADTEISKAKMDKLLAKADKGGKEGKKKG